MFSSVELTTGGRVVDQGGVVAPEEEPDPLEAARATSSRLSSDLVAAGRRRSGSRASTWIARRRPSSAPASAATAAACVRARRRRWRGSGARRSPARRSSRSGLQPDELVVLERGDSARRSGGACPQRSQPPPWPRHAARRFARPVPRRACRPCRAEYRGPLTAHTRSRRPGCPARAAAAAGSDGVPRATSWKQLDAWAAARTGRPASCRGRR